MGRKGVERKSRLTNETGRREGKEKKGTCTPYARNSRGGVDWLEKLFD